MNSRNQGWGLAISDAEKGCIIHQWAPIRIPLKPPYFSCRRKAIKAQAHNKIHEVSRLDIETALQEISDGEEQFRSVLTLLLNNQGLDILCLKVNDHD